MKRFAVRCLSDLLATTEAVRNNQCLLCRSTNFGQQNAFTARERDIDMLLLKSKAPGHSAAAGVWTFEFHTHFFEQFFFTIKIQKRFVVTITMYQGAT